MTHGRIVSLLHVQVDYEAIAQIKQSVSIPVVANGSPCLPRPHCRDDAQCNAVMR